MSRRAVVAVVGAGIAGAATARALAESHASVVLFEQFALGHARGSSHGTSRIFRLNYPDERFVRMTQSADAGWRALERESSATLIDRVGSLDVGPVTGQTARALEACGVEYEILSASEVGDRWPILLEPGETAVFQRDGGVTHADRAHAAFVESAVAGGAEVHPDTTVRAISPDRHSVLLTLDDDQFVADAVVVTAGSWAPALVSSLGIELPVTVTRETVAYFELTGAGELPPVIDYARLPGPREGGSTRAGRASYGLAAPGVGLKAGVHHSGPEADPTVDVEPDTLLADWVAGWVSSRYESVARALGAETCLYTNTTDDRFLLERHGRVVIGSACSGHGFKFAPVVGRRLADLALAAAA